MAKYQDRVKSKHSPTIINRKDGEGWKERHWRRLQKNKEHLDKFRQWCLEFGCDFRYLNNGEHWKVKHGTTCFDWWPRSAKLIVNQQWKRGVHVHDYMQLIKFIEGYNG